MAIHDEYRKKFHDLTDQANAIRAKSQPLRDERDAKIDELTGPQLKEFRDKIIAAEEGLFDIENERAMMVRALGGKTGIRQEDGSITMPTGNSGEAKAAEAPQEA